MIRLEKTYVKTFEFEGNVFRVEIFDDEWNLPYTRIFKVLRPKKNIFDFSYEKEIFNYWVESKYKNNRIELAKDKIAEYLMEEKNVKDFEKALDKWADYSV